MFRIFAVSLIALPCAVSTFLAAAAEQPGQSTGAPADVCTDGAAGPAPAVGKHIWADSRLYTDAPPLEVQKWLSGKPETDGKFLVIEFWRTWCGACKRLTPLMNTLQKKYGQELVVIGITGEAEATVNAYAGPKKEYPLALDLPRPAEGTNVTQVAQSADAPDAATSLARPDLAEGQAASRPGQGLYESAFNVWGWPHVVILEPQYRTIIWEGFPGLKGFELTEAKVEKMLAINRALKKEEEAKKK